MESGFSLMSKKIWDIYIDSLILLIMAILRACCLESHWYLLVVNSTGLMKVSNWDYYMVKCLGFYLGI